MPYSGHPAPPTGCPPPAGQLLGASSGQDGSPWLPGHELCTGSGAPGTRRLCAAGRWPVLLTQKTAQNEGNRVKASLMSPRRQQAQALRGRDRAALGAGLLQGRSPARGRWLGAPPGSEHWRQACPAQEPPGEHPCSLPLAGILQPRAAVCRRPAEGLTLLSGRQRHRPQTVVTNTLSSTVPDPQRQQAHRTQLHEQKLAKSTKSRQRSSETPLWEQPRCVKVWTSSKVLPETRHQQK